MTMLDRMRRHKAWLQWSLVLVVLAFIIFYIPDFLRGSGADATSGETIASVEGHAITSGEFRRTYTAQLQAYRSAYGGNMSEQLLKQLGIEQQILQQMVDEQASLAEARRLGIEVSDEEVRQRIFAIPAFQENGRFIGEQRYQQLLRMQRPPLSPSDFEDGIRRSLTVEKLRASLTDWLSVPDKELEQEYRRRNDKVKLAVVSFTADKFRSQVAATDPEIAAHFEAHKNDFKMPEKRKIRFLLIDVDALRAKIVVPEADVKRAYNDNIEQVLDARTDPRQPHPAQDRRQRRCGGESEGRGHPEAGESRRGFRRAREEVFRRRIEREERRRPRLLRARQDGAGVRRRRVHAAAGSDQRRW